MRWLFIAFVALFCGFSYWAKSPLFLDGDEKPEKPTIFVATPPPPEKPKDVPPEDVPLTDPLANLAPESFQTDPQMLNAGFGMGYGSGGPALGSAMGLGGNMDQMVKDQTAVDRPARAVYKSQLDYPTDARNRGLSGNVTLRLLVEATGALADVKVEQASPAGVFENAAINAVRQWRFDPAFVKGQATRSWLTQKIRFELN